MSAGATNKKIIIGIKIKSIQLAHKIALKCVPAGKQQLELIRAAAAKVTRALNQSLSSSHQIGPR